MQHEPFRLQYTTAVPNDKRIMPEAARTNSGTSPAGAMDGEGSENERVTDTTTFHWHRNERGTHDLDADEACTAQTSRHLNDTASTIRPH